PVIATKYEYNANFIYPVILVYYQSITPYPAQLAYTWAAGSQRMFINETMSRSDAEYFEITEQKVNCVEVGIDSESARGECLLARLVPTAKLTPKAYSQLTISGFAVASRTIHGVHPDLLSLFHSVRNPNGPDVLPLATMGGNDFDSHLTTEIIQTTLTRMESATSIHKGLTERFYSLYTSSSHLAANISVAPNSPRTWMSIVQGPAFQHVQEEVPTMTVAEVINSIAAPWTVVVAVFGILFGMERIRTTGLVQRYFLHPKVWAHEPPPPPQLPHLPLPRFTSIKSTFGRNKAGQEKHTEIQIEHPEGKNGGDEEAPPLTLEERLARLEEFENLMRGHFVVIDHEKFRN
ncbi:hypothetical protein HK097_001586, partial [Rhizophlyctis rosea]